MLLLMDGTADAERLLDCSIKIFHKQKDHFCGAFVDGISFNNLNQIFDTKEHISTLYTYSEIIKKILNSNLKNSNNFIHRFVKKCEDLDLRIKVFIGQEVTNDDLVKESIFNDLFLIGKDIFRRINFSLKSIVTIESLIRNTKCPIVLLSCEQISFQNIVLIYDGSRCSFNTIKLFMYLMNDSVQKNNLILNVVVTENSFSNEKSVIDYLKNYKQHFSIIRVYPDNYYKELLALLMSLSSFLLVTGINRNGILEDLIFNKEDSFFMHEQRSIFFG